jgi:hypothetical protein
MFGLESAGTLPDGIISSTERMRALIDFTQIPLSRTGVGVYADHLIANLLPLLREDDSLTLYERQ